MSEAPSPVPARESVPGFYGMDRLRAALFALAVFVLAPLPGLIKALKEHDSFGVAYWPALILLGLLPPLGLWKGKRWAFIVGLYVCWPGLIYILVDGMRNSFKPWFYAAGAPLYAMLIVSFNASRPSREPAAEKRPPEPFGRWLKENVEAIVIAFIMALVIRCFCIEVFKIPSSSMEPTLLGDVNKTHQPRDCPFEEYHVDSGGDRIMVTKYYYAFSEIERFDVVVFKFPLNQAKNFIKRVVGLPNEHLKIWRGNLYVKKQGEDKFRIVRRPLRVQNSIWITPREFGEFMAGMDTFSSKWNPVGPGDKSKRAGFDLIGRELSTYESTEGERGIKFELKDPPTDGSDPVGDLHVALDFELTSPKGQFFAEIANEHGRFEVRIDTDGVSELRQYPVGIEKSQPVDHAPFKNTFRPEMDRTYRLDFAVYDGRACVILDGDVVAETKPFIEFREGLATPERAETGVAFGSRGLTFKARNLKVGRDIYYRDRGSYLLGLRDDTPVKIPDGHYLMMGDNVANSHDSRAWVETTFTLKDGTKIVCEWQEVNRLDIQERLQEKLKLKDKPDFGIEADQHGNEHALFNDDLAPAPPEEQNPHKKEFRIIDRKYIVGKALWIWWPRGRWFTLIR